MRIFVKNSQTLELPGSKLCFRGGNFFDVSPAVAEELRAAGQAESEAEYAARLDAEFVAAQAAAQPAPPAEVPAPIGVVPDFDEEDGA